MRVRAGFLVITVLFLSGCAFGDRVATLKYPPAADKGGANAAVKGKQAPMAAKAARQSVVVGRFTDSRANKKVIGFVQNGYGMKTADVKTETDVSEWVRKAIAHELRRRGYAVTLADTATPGTRALFVTGNVEKALTKAYFKYDAEIVFTADIKRGRSKVGGSRYVGHGSAGANIAGTAERFGRSLSLALQEALQRFVADVNAVSR